MASSARRRLLKDMQAIRNDKDEGYAAVPFQDNLLMWSAVIYGPEDTIWQGGIFKLQIECTQQYPKQPPHIVFKTQMFHPNIYNDGKICLDILQNQWSPIYDIAAVLRSIRSLLADPNPDSPANTMAAQMYVNNKKQYARNVRDIVQHSWTV